MMTILRLFTSSSNKGHFTPLQIKKKETIRTALLKRVFAASHLEMLCFFRAKFSDNLLPLFSKQLMPLTSDESASNSVSNQVYLEVLSPAFALSTVKSCTFCHRV